MFEHIARRRDYYAGALVSLIGAAAATQALSYGIGDLSAIGPGFFPLVMGLILAVTGPFIALARTDGDERQGGAHQAGAQPAEAFRPEWRGWIAIIASVLAFMALARVAGLFAATFACVLIAALGDPTTTVKSALVLAIAVATVGVLLFYYGLHVQIRPFGA